MTWFANLPVQRKLGYAMLTTTVVALLLACCIFFAVEYRSYRSDIKHTVATLAKLTADNSTAAIAFEDWSNGAQILEALRAEPQIVSAALYDADGRLFASFQATPDEMLPAYAGPGPAQIIFAEQGYVVGVQPVMEDSRRLGTLYVRASMAEIFHRMLSYLWVVLFVLASAIALAGLVASWLRHTLARPILELANTANAVTARQDYSLRARQYGQDELGRLTATFNAMLEKSQATVGALRESEWGYRELVRALPTAAYMCDARGCITIYNEAAVNLWGRNPELGREFWCGSYKIFNPDGSPLALDRCPMAVALREARSVRGQEIIIERPDGTRRDVLPHPEPIRDTAGNVVGIVNMLVDITEQKQASAAMRQLAAIVESSDDAIIARDLDGIITAWNHGAERLYGYTAAEIVGQSVTLLIPADRIAEEPAILNHIRHDERIEVYETVRRRRDGTLIDVSLMVSPIKDAAGRIIGASKIARDITARKHAEQALQASETQLRLVTDNAPVLLVRTDREHRYTFVNRAYAERNGYTPQAMIGLRVPEVVGQAAYEAFKPQMEAALAGERVEFEIKIPYKHIGPRWVHVMYVPERDGDGRVVGLLAVLTDTGARKEAEIELKRARDEAVAAARAKDDFLAALSHELRTPLNPVLLLASDAAADPNLPPAIRAQFELIRKNVNLEARLIDDLLDLTRISRGKLRLETRHCDLRAIIRDALTNVQPDLMEKRQRLTVDTGEQESIVVGDSVRLQQIFWNVLKNAVKFTAEGGRIQISVRHGPTPGKVQVKVTDSGIGMTRDEIDRVFQAFTQGDHAQGGGGSHLFGGLGLGLAITKTLVELHEGQIHATSEGRNLGSSFIIELPLAPAQAGSGLPAARSLSVAPFADSRAAQKSGSANPLPAPTAPMRVLLVEDHAATRNALQHLLRNRDYRVTAAASAGDALRQARAGTFDLIISDVGLPDRSGYELMAELRTFQPQLIGIALSGYGMEEDFTRSKEAGFSTHLIKPITIGMLEEAIAALKRTAAAGSPASSTPA